MPTRKRYGVRQDGIPKRVSWSSKLSVSTSLVILPTSKTTPSAYGISETRTKIGKLSEDLSSWADNKWLLGHTLPLGSVVRRSINGLCEDPRCLDVRYLDVPGLMDRPSPCLCCLSSFLKRRSSLAINAERSFCGGAHTCQWSSWANAKWDRIFH